MKIFKKIVLIVILLCVIAATSFVGVGYMNYVKATKKVSIDDKIAQIKKEDTFVPYDEINDKLFEATVSIEDRRFYQHNGVDYRSMARALINNIFDNGIKSGGSTITQQLAKNMYYTYQPSYVRKVSEIFTAYALEKKLSKKEILELYVNVINYGDNHIGIKEASEGYFHKEPKDLTLKEATLLAGLPQSPANYQLSNHKAAALVRQKQVLEAMLRDHKITKKQMDDILQ